VLFPEPHSEDNLHIVVQCPAEDDDHEGKRKRTRPDENTHKLPSEHSLHKLWMLAREPQTTLVETRPVQRDKSCLSTETNLPLDCTVLRGGDWVQELQPDSHFTGVLIRNEYVGALRAIMKWFLSIDEVTEDAMEVDDIEPAPLENPFLDVPNGLVSKRWAFVLLGDPGIGKTALLYVLLVLRLRAQLPTIYQSRDSHLYYFADDGVSLINLTPSPIASNFKSRFHRSTWCLIDSNQSLDTVPVFIQDLDLFIVQASSPRPHRYAWIDKATRPVLRYFMKSWTLPELLVGRVLQDEVCSEAQIEFFSTRYGTSARSVYTNASQPLNYETSLLEKMELFPINLSLFPLVPLAMPLSQRFRPATFTRNFGTAFLPTSWRQPLASTTSLSETRTPKFLLVSCWKMLQMTYFSEGGSGVLFP